MTVRKRFLLAGLLLVGVVLFGASGFHYIEGWPWFDGFYMTIVTMTTVGYEETHPLSGASKVLNSFLIVAAVASDADNLYIVLTARGMKPDLTIVARASEEEALPKFKRAGATHVVSPYHFVGRRIARLFLRPHVLELIDNAFGSERLDMEIEEVPVAEKSALAGKTLADSEIRQKTGVMVLAVKLGDGRMHFNPAPDVVIHTGDCLIAIGAADHLEKLASLANS